MSARRTLSIMAWSLTALWLLASHSPAQSPQTSLEFRRVFVPVEQLKELTAGHIPVKTEEFQQLLATVGSAQRNPGTANVRLLDAVYSARLEQSDLVAGAARLRLVHNNTQTARLSLAPCSLAVGAATWEKDSSAARFGTDAAGKPMVVVDPVASETATPVEATLHLAWTQRGARDPSGSLLFDLQTPACPSSRLELDLPNKVTPVVTVGIVSKVVGTSDGSNWQRWSIELGGRTQTTLSIVSEEALQRKKRYVLDRGTTTYALTSSGLEATFEHRLDIYREALRQVSFTVDTDLRIAAVTLDDTSLPWSVTPAVDKKTERLTIEFPEPLVGNDRRLRVQALAPLQREQPWPLPQLAVHDVIWQEGTVSLQVAQGLELCDLDLHDLQQVKSVEASADAPRDYRFQKITTDGALGVFIRNRADRLECDEGLTLKWDGPHLTGRLISNLVAREGECFALQGQVSPGWILDSVETTPADALDDWMLNASEGRAAQLVIRFAQAVTTERPVQVKVLGHRRAPQRNEHLQPREFRMVDWQPLARHRRLVAVQAEAQQQLALTGDLGLQRLEARNLDTSDRALVDATTSRLVFLDSSATPGFALALRSESPRFAAESLARVSLSRENLTEAYAIRILPDTTPISRVVVRLSATLPGPVQWKIAKDGPETFTARQLAADDSELWELSFLTPQAMPVTVTAERQTVLRPGDPPREVPLVVVNEAETQQAEVIIEALDGAQPVIEDRGLSHALIGDTHPHACARFRYQYAPDQQLTISHAEPGQRRSLAWAWRQHLVARVADVGEMVCSATYQVENRGEPQVSFRLPKGATLRQVRVDGLRIPSTTTAAQEFTVALPPDERYPLLQFEYALTGAPMALWQAVPIVAPETALPILHTQTEIWLAPGLRLSSDRSAATSNWRQRLFGPLARDASEPMPSLLSTSAWQVNTASQLTSAADLQRALQCQFAFEQSLLQLAKAESVTWGALLLKYAEQDGAQPLRIDYAALAGEGIYGDTPIDNAATVGFPALLRDAGLILLTAEDHILVSSRATQSLLTGDSERTDSVVLPLAVTAPAQNEGHLTTAAWLATPEVARSPWRVVGRSTTRDLEAAGWTRHHLPEMDQTQAAVVFRWREVLALAWGLLLAAIGLTAWLVRRVARGYFGFVAIASLAALCLPAMFAPLGTAAFLGSLLGGLGGWLTHRRPLPVRMTSRPAPSESRRIAAVSGLALFSLFIAWQQVGAQLAPQPPIAEAFRVLVPVDSANKPTGAYVYLPRTFYDTLARLAKNAKAVPQGWAIYEATYRGNLHARSPGKLQFADLVASYDIEVFQPGTRVQVGLAREHVHLLDDRVNLEGTPVRVDWLESGEGFTFLVDKAGRYRLEVALQPVPTLAGARQQVDLRIPQLSRASLQLKAPAEALGVQIAGAQGHTAQPEPTSWRVDLGPTSRLTVYWPLGEGEESQKKDVEVSQLLWWKVRAGDVVLESQWKFISGSEPQSEVRLIADRRLKMLPLADDQPVAEQSVREGDVQAIHLTLKEPKQREVTLRASFTLADTTGIGQLVLPRLEAVADRTTRRWLAITADSGLEAIPAKSDTLAPITQQEFAVAWGGMESPDAVYALPDKDSLITFTVRPRDMIWTARQALTYAIEASHVRAELESIVQVANGAVYQHHLQLPADWSIESATVTEAGLTSKVRSAACENGEQTLFLPAGISGEHRLLVSLRGPLPTRKAWTLPEVRLLTPDRDAPLVFIERASQLSVAIASHPGYEAVADTSPAPADILWRRVAVLRPLPTPSPRQIQVQVERQTPTLRARQVIAVQSVKGAWQATVDIRGNITGGALEVLRLEVPAELSGAKLDLAGKLSSIVVPGQTRHYLVASLDAPLNGQFKALLTIPLGTSAAERLQVPDVRFLDAETVETFVVLPTSVDGQQLMWDTRSLQSATLSRDEYPAIADNTLVLAAPSNRFQATVKRFERSAGVPHVRLADVTMHLVSPTSAYGVSSIDLEPAGLSECAIRIPAGQALIHATVNGTSVTTLPSRGGELRIPLQHDRLPQHIELLFAFAQLSTIDAAEAPTLVDIPVERTLWTIASPAQHVGAFMDEEAVVDADRALSIRLKNAATLLKHSASHAGEASSDTDQASIWFANWCRRSTRLQADFQQRHASDEETSTNALANELQSLATDAQELGQQWGASEAIAAALNNAPQAESLAAVCATQLSHDTSLTRAALSGATSSVPLAAPPGRFRDWFRQALALLVVATILLFVSAASRSPITRETLSRSPHLVGVAAGIAWWFLLAPAGLGLLIAVAFVVASLWFPWPRLRDLTRSTLHPGAASRPR